jgi:Tol biopolymer transport system component
MNRKKVSLVFWLVSASILAVSGCRGLISPPTQPREASILFLSPAGDHSRLWQSSLDGKQKQALTSENEVITSYGVSHDGNLIAYSVENALGGADIWTMDRQGKQKAQTVTCDNQICIDPAWSPDGKRIAYSRSEKGSEKSRIWLINLATKNTAPLYADTAIAGELPSWSPDGEFLSAYDRRSGGIRIVNMKTSKDQLLQTEIPIKTSWSPDGKFLFIITQENMVDIPYTAIYRYDLSSFDLAPLFSGGNEGINFSVPQFSNDGEWAAVGVRLPGEGHNSQLWLMKPDGSELKDITTDPTVSYADFSWNPASTAILFQRLGLSSSQSRPEVGIWNFANGSITVISGDASQPAWLP